jgi:hypothetical protein
MTSTRRLLIWLVATSLSFAGMLQGAQAALIGTDQLVAMTSPQAQSEAHARLNGLLARDDVASALLARGVSPDQVRARVAALSDAEAAQVAAQIDTAPAAGSDVLGVILLVFLVLLFTDIMGWTKVFPFTRSMR